MARVLAGGGSHPTRHWATVALLLAFVAACARPDDRVQTAGGQTYVVFRGLDRACIKAGIVRELTTFDWTVEIADQSRIVARQPAPAWINTAVLLASFNPPLVQIILSLEPAGPDTKVLINAGAIVDPAVADPSVRPIQTTAQMKAVFGNSVQRIEQECGGRSRS